MSGPDRRAPGARIQAVISDFGGVLTSPLMDSFLAFQRASGVPLAALGQAMAALADRQGNNPLFELETGRLSEAEFLAQLGEQLSAQLGRPVSLQSWGQHFLGQLAPNPRMIEFMRELRGRGYRMAICTNNIREWDALWRAKLPVQEIFDVVVDSAFVGHRKPERRIYEITLERLGVAPAAALFIDDLEVNCAAAGALGMTTVHFRDNDQAIAEIEQALGSPPPVDGWG